MSTGTSSTSSMDTVPEYPELLSGPYDLVEPPDARFSILESFAKVTSMYNTIVSSFSRNKDQLNVYETLTASELADIALGYPGNNYSNHMVWDETLEHSTNVGQFEVLSTNACPLPLERKRESCITPQEWAAFFDVTGKVSVPVQSIKKRIFKGGCHGSIRKEVYAYILDLSNWNKTNAQNQDHRRVSRRTYTQLKKSCKLTLSKRSLDSQAYLENLERIEKDVVRTDRHLEFYKRHAQEQSIKLEIDSSKTLSQLRNILMTYTSSPSMQLEFVQGMADLASPLLFLNRDESDAYWCFSFLMDRMVLLISSRNLILHKMGSA